MRLRKSFNIRGTTYAIVRKRFDGCVDKLGRVDLGEINLDEKTITILLRLKKIEVLKTLVHEIFHGLEEEYGIEVGHDMINKLQGPIADFIMENFL